jgi:hypothetical protein
MRRTLLITIVALLAAGPADVWAQKDVAAAVEAKALREMAAAIPPGSRVKLQTTSGKRISGTLMSASATEIVVKKQTRLPEPAVAIPIDELSRLERDDKRGMHLGKVIGIGLAAGAGAILSLVALAFALGD